MTTSSQILSALPQELRSQIESDIASRVRSRELASGAPASSRDAETIALETLIVWGCARPETMLAALDAARVALHAHRETAYTARERSLAYAAPADSGDRFLAGQPTLEQIDAKYDAE